MASRVKLSPLRIYLIGLALMVLSRVCHSIAVVSYVFAIAGIGAIAVAILKYFRSPNRSRR